MKSKKLIELITQLKEQDYNYYCDPDHASLKNPFCEEYTVEGFKTFINDYFSKAEKSDCVELSPIALESEIKEDHVCSAFFLGVLIFKNTSINKTPLYKSINIKEQNDSISGNGTEDFRFLWFLTCLYHDHTFSKESDASFISKLDDFNSLNNILTIFHQFVTEDVSHIEKRLLDSIVNYFNYNLICRNKADHGIIAGCYLYDRLIKLRRKQEQKGTGERYWGQDLEKVYATISATIAAHNIWLPVPEKESIYKHFGLEKLINFQPVKIKNSPLLFILGLTDTLDPVKTFKANHSVKEILENLECKFYKNSIHIKNAACSTLDFSILQRKVDNLLGWLDVSITKKHNYLRIKFN
jgi:hypothetical protein